MAEAFVLKESRRTSVPGPMPLVLVILALFGCNDPPEGPSALPTFVIAPAQQWSGGVATIRSAYFQDLSQLPRIDLDTIELSAIRIDDSTVSVQLPTLPSGSYNLSLHRSTGASTIGRIDLAGFRRRREVSPGFYDARLTVLETFAGRLVVGGPALHSLRVSSGVVTQYPGLWATDYGISPSYLGADVAVVRDPGGVARQYRFGPGQPVLVDSARALSGPFDRHLATFSPDIHLITGSHDSWTDSVGKIRGFRTESVYSVYLSPRGDRALLGLSVGEPGALVFDMVTGDTAYTLPLRSVLGGAFTPDGQVLYASGGGDWYLQDRLLAVNSATGAILAQHSAVTGDPAPDTAYYALDLGHFGTRLFAVSTEQDSIPVLAIHDAATLQRIARLVVPVAAGAGCRWACWGAVVIADEIGGVAYIVNPGEPAVILEFDLLQP